MSLLLLKLVATPALVGLAGWASRRWGPAVGGWFAGVPITSGPISLFLALQYGPEFAAGAALGTLWAMPAIAAYGIAYVAAARAGAGWVACLVASQAAYGGAFLLLHQVEPGAGMVFAVAAASVAAGIALAQLRDRPVLVSLSSDAVLLLRIAVATAMVLLITGIAPYLGPALSGFVATILVIAAVLAAAGHREHGAAGGIAVMRGLALGQVSFLAFYAVVWCLLPRLGIAPAYLAALVAAAAIGMAVARLLRRR